MERGKIFVNRLRSLSNTFSKMEEDTNMDRFAEDTLTDSSIKNTEILTMIKLLYGKIIQYKSHIIIISYAISIIYTSIWYSCFGLNTFSYLNVMDTFFSLFEYLLLPVCFTLCFFCTSLLLSLFIKEKFSIFLISGILSVIYFYVGISFNIFRPFFSLFELVIYLMLTLYFFSKNYKKLLLIGVAVFTIGMAVFMPILSHRSVVNSMKEVKEGAEVKVRSSIPIHAKWNTDYYSFMHQGVLINTESDSLYSVGNTTQYFFIYNSNNKRTYVYPKNECENISTKIASYSFVKKGKTALSPNMRKLNKLKYK